MSDIDREDVPAPVDEGDLIDEPMGPTTLT